MARRVFRRRCVAATIPAVGLAGSVPPVGSFFTGESGFFDDWIALDLVPGSPVEVGEQATCRAEAAFPENRATPAYANGHARVDPTEIPFDQATFDARMGGETFPLGDDDRIDASPNALHAVPIGSVATGLTLASLLGLGSRALARRRAQQGIPTRR